MQISHRRGMTRQLFEEDSYQQNFDAVVQECIPMEGKFGIVLDATCFYPESGGQSGDEGTLNDTAVITTQLKQGKIFHLVHTALKVGQTVHGHINWPHRWDLMQFHTGQHLISAVCWEFFQAETTSIHVSPHLTTIDLDKPVLTSEEVTQIEDQVNQLILEHRPVHIHWIEKENDLKRFPLRTQPKKKGEKGYRIVEIDHYDYSPCGGTHLRNTGDLRVFKILKWIRVKDSIKVEFVVGDRALRDYGEKHRILTDTTALLGIRESDLPQTVSKLQQDLRGSLQQIENLWDRLATLELPSILAAASMKGKYRIITRITQDRNLQELLYLEKKLAENSNYLIFLGNIQGGEQKVQLVFGRSSSWESPQYTAKELHMGQLVREIALQLKGKGGGKPEFAQGSGEFDIQHPDTLNIVFEKLNQKILSILSE